MQVMEIISGLRKPIEDIVKRSGQITEKSLEVGKRMDAISIATAEQAESIVEISEDSDLMTNMAENMRGTVNEFKI